MCVATRIVHGRAVHQVRTASMRGPTGSRWRAHRLSTTARTPLLYTHTHDMLHDCGLGELDCDDLQLH